VTEHWTPVTGYEGLYEVSDQGQVRSLKRLVRYIDGRLRTFPSCVLAQYTSGSTRGYPFITLSRDNRQYPRPVHRLVLEAFQGACPEGMEALHGPGGKTDASLTNLRWGTRAENTGPDRVRDGQSNRGEKSGLAKLTWTQVCEIRERVAAGETQTAVARELGVSFQNVSMIVHRKTWRHPPEEW
jgi:hypothetical protein